MLKRHGFIRKNIGGDIDVMEEVKMQAYNEWR